jgi:acetyltransferase-like isoleucine patch superfamily enzyme
MINYFKNRLYILKNRLYSLYNIIIVTRGNAQLAPNANFFGIIYLKNEGRIEIGKDFISRSGKYQNPIGGDTVLRLIVYKNAQLLIGDNVGISNSTILCTNSIKIGNNVLIGGSCKIWDSDFHPLDFNLRRITLDGAKKVPIVIGNDVFIGGSSIILKGVTIGDRAIIGAGSVITKDIPPDEIWAGNPARFIRKNI